jgi:magnesium-transporting ATPase (P-type)
VQLPHQAKAICKASSHAASPPLLPAEVYGFSSERKMASVLVKRPGGKLRLYNKGAAEMVLSRCAAMVDAAGEQQPMTEVRLLCGCRCWSAL